MRVDALLYRANTVGLLGGLEKAATAAVAALIVVIVTKHAAVGDCERKAVLLLLGALQEPVLHGQDVATGGEAARGGGGACSAVADALDDLELGAVQGLASNVLGWRNGVPVGRGVNVEERGVERAATHAKGAVVLVGTQQVGLAKPLDGVPVRARVPAC